MVLNTYEAVSSCLHFSNGRKGLRNNEVLHVMYCDPSAMSHQMIKQSVCQEIHEKKNPAIM